MFNYLVGFKKYKLILAYISFLSLINQSILKNFDYYRFVHIQKNYSQDNKDTFGRLSMNKKIYHMIPELTSPYPCSP